MSISPRPRSGVTQPSAGVLFALGAALLFGISTPAAKALGAGIAPQLLAGLLYLGAGLGLVIWMGLRKLGTAGAPPLRKPRGREWGWLAAAVISGGIIGPVLLMQGLARTDGAAASLLLNLESVLTCVLAWIVFKEKFSPRVLIGMSVIFAGGLIISWNGTPSLTTLAGPLLVAAACLSWALDNNFTRKIADCDPLFSAAVKGGAGAAVNCGIAVMAGAALPGAARIAGALLVGFLGYGLSIVCFIMALRSLGAARTGAFFAIAPFFGALTAVAFGMSLFSGRLLATGAVMAVGVWLLLNEHSPEPVD